MTSARVKILWEVVSGKDVEELQLVFETVLTLKDSYLQAKSTMVIKNNYMFFTLQIC